MIPETETERTFLTLTTTLPGPDRKRTAAEYEYHLTYRNPDPQSVGCVLLWEVHGGRMSYQIAIEREESGEMRSHCTCPDAVYRANVEDHVCKHIRGFLQLGKGANQEDTTTDAAPRRCA